MKKNISLNPSTKKEMKSYHGTAIWMAIGNPCKYVKDKAAPRSQNDQPLMT